MTKPTRIESDSLGEVAVPTDALYGAQTQRAIDNFPISGRRFGRRFLEAMGRIKAAAAHTNVELGLLDESAGAAIVRAACEVADGQWDAEFPLDIYQTGSGTSTNMNTNEVIATLANRYLNHGAAAATHDANKSVHANDHVNLGQSSNDTIPSAIHIACRLALRDHLLPALACLQGALATKAAAFDGVLKSGRTHLMDATPVRLGQEFGGYAMQVKHGIRRLERADDELAELALGGTATGSGINTHVEFAPRTIERLSAELGMEFREAENHFEAQGARDACVSLAGALNTVAAGLMKIADDVRWMASGPTSGLAEIAIPAVQPGSSIMPGKVNPVLCEALMMVCARVAGNTTTVTIAGGRGNFELNAMMPVIADALLESISLLANATSAFASRCIEGIEAQSQHALEVLERNPAIVTALSPLLGYKRAVEVATRAAAESRSIREMVAEMGLLSEATLDAVLSLHAMTEPGLPKKGGDEAR